MPSHEPLVIGLTGGIGAGKSTVAALLAEHGAIIVDCDELGRLVLEPTGSAFDLVVDRFGPSILNDAGEINRGELASVVFSDADALTDLNALTHPAIDAEIALRIEQSTESAPSSPVVLDMAVLAESTLGRGMYTYVVVVEAPLDQRVDRLVATRGMQPSDAQARIDSQASDEQRRSIADTILHNKGSLEDLATDVARLWASLQRR